MDVERAGDRVTVESERVGESSREGVILEVLGSGEMRHYRIRWDDGHESTIYPSGGSLTIVPRSSKSKRAGKKAP